MALFNNRNEKLSTENTNAILDMVKGSLDAHVQKLKSMKKKMSTYSAGCNDSTFYDPLIEVYEQGLADISGQFEEAVNSDQEISVQDFLNGVFTKLSEKAAGRVDKNNPYFNKYFYGDLAFQWEDYNFYKLFNAECQYRDNNKEYDKSSSPFKLATEPLEGVEDIGEYNPDADSVKPLYEGRTGNSGTMKTKIDDLKRQIQEVRDNANMKNAAKEKKIQYLQEKIDKAEFSPFGLHMGAEVSRIHSSKLKAKMTKGDEPITFADLYNTLTDLNVSARANDPDGGKFRGDSVVAGTLRGVSPSAAPAIAFRTLDDIADYMNRIRKTEDPALRKTQAIQLASYAYQMTLSEHLFADGNGRTCRLFSDTILQSFGLPPHTPSKEVSSLTDSLGLSIDFNKGANVFLSCVKTSDNILKAEKAKINEAAKEAGHPENENGELIDNIHAAAGNKAAKDIAHMGQDEARHALDGFKELQSYADTLKDQWNAMASHSLSAFNSSEFGKMKKSFDKFMKDYENVVTKGMGIDGKPSIDPAEDLKKLKESCRVMRMAAHAYTFAKRRQMEGGIEMHKSQQGRDRLAMADAIMGFELNPEKLKAAPARNVEIADKSSGEIRKVDISELFGKERGKAARNFHADKLLKASEAKKAAMNNIGKGSLGRVLNI